jgi:hypothetical protein
MPRIALVCLGLVGGCSFDADYAGGTYACSLETDPKCPSGLECRDHVCREPRLDAAIDTAMDDVMIDTPPTGQALTCVDPGLLTSGTAVSGTTVSRASLMSSFCTGGGGVQNGPDAVYRITTATGGQLLVSITGNLNAYVITAATSGAPCMMSPNTPACLGGAVATMGNPISVAVGAGQYFVVVDNLNAGVAGPYTLTVTVQ